MGSFKPVAVLLGLLLLSACQTTPDGGDSRNLRGAAYSLEQVPVLLQEAQEASPAERPPILLDAVEVVLSYGETDWARNIISGINPSALPDATYGRHQLLASRIAVQAGSHFAAERHLTEIRLEQILPSLSTELTIALREQRAQVFQSISDYTKSIHERVIMDDLMANSPTADEEERNLNQDALWQTLMQLPVTDLERLQNEATDPTLAGWYSLASVSKNHQANLSRQLAMVDDWARRWPAHPASLRLPADLQLLRHLVENQPSRVALLLPLTGRLEQASTAIRDGFMAAYYDAAQKGEPQPDIRLYDTAAMEVNSAYDQAVLDGAEVIVGPLEKDSIAEIALRPQLPMPTLALNNADVPFADFERLYQFGLAVEDEAKQVAQQAWRDGNRRALILAPASDWGDRSVDTFRQEWQTLGGEVTRDYRFGNNDYLGLLAEALHITESRQRTRELQRMLGRGLEFEPRRRQDVDMIFLVAQPQQARQIKPTLAFHYAGNIPVYATSHIYSGEDPSSNQDMNGIRFTNLPWFFATDAPEYQALKRHGDAPANYQRLFALGADAYHLYPRLRQLREVTQARYYGYTGALSLNEQGKVEREQAWAQFIGGVAQPMPSPRDDEQLRIPEL